MSNSEYGKLSEQEKKIVNLQKSEDFRKEISTMQNEPMSKEERIGKIKAILSQKGIEYTEEDAELFDSLIAYANEKKIKLGNSELDGISGGFVGEREADLSEIPPDMMERAIDISELPKDIQDKIIQQNKGGMRKAKLIVAAVLGGAFLLGGGIGFPLGYHFGKKSLE